jgi:hypothetical protein
MAKQGLYYNINQKQKRIASGSGEKMRSPGDKGAPSADDFTQSAKTAKPEAAKTKKKPSVMARAMGLTNK